MRSRKDFVSGIMMRPRYNHYLLVGLLRRRCSEVGGAGVRGIYYVDLDLRLAERYGRTRCMRWRGDKKHY